MHALGDYEVTDAFLDDVDTHRSIVTPVQVLRTVVDVLTRRRHEQTWRRPQPDGDTPPRADQAQALRCLLTRQHRQGPYLHWWQHPNGKIELTGISTTGTLTPRTEHT